MKKYQPTSIQIDKKFLIGLKHEKSYKFLGEILVRIVYGLFVILNFFGYKFKKSK